MAAASSTLTDRASALVRTFRAAFAALDDCKSSTERQLVYDFIASHVRAASPMSFALPDPALIPPALDAVQPETHVRRELGDGAAYDVTIADGFLRLVLKDVTGDDTMHHFEAETARAFRDDLSRVLAAMETVL